MHLLRELRRNRRTKLKKKCYPKDESKEEVLAKIPGWAKKQQYADLVDYWFDLDTEAKESGQAVEHAVLFMKVYSKKDGTPSEQRHQEQIANMHAKHKEEFAKLHARHKVEITEAVVNATINILDQLQPFLNTLSVAQRSITMSSLDESSTYVLTETSSIKQRFIYKPVIYIIITEKSEKDKKNRF
nr:hypothetical protein CFP56_67900 [Quercus suber]